MNKEPRTKNEEQPLVSVCIGTFNREATLPECLDSVLAQAYENWEIILADNASADGTLDLARTYRNTRIIERAANSGMCSTTRNLAAGAARGKYIAFLDSDDAWLPEKLEKQVAWMEAHPEVPLCHTYCLLMDEASAVYGVRHEGRLPPSGDYFEALLDHCWITISSVMIRRELYEEMGPFNETLPYGRSGEDYEFFLKVASRYSVGLINEPLTKYRKSRHSITAGDWRSQPHALLFYKELLNREDVWAQRSSRQEMVQRYNASCVENAIHWRDQRKPARSLWAIGQGVRVKPFSVALWREGVKSLGRAVWPG
jgi:glycosyltransferase involved in cell wall biosynthesis